VSSGIRKQGTWDKDAWVAGTQTQDHTGTRTQGARDLDTGKQGQVARAPEMPKEGARDVRHGRSRRTDGDTMDTNTEYQGHNIGRQGDEHSTTGCKGHLQTQHTRETDTGGYDNRHTMPDKRALSTRDISTGLMEQDTRGTRDIDTGL
jgi:hypothetical protein